MRVLHRVFCLGLFAASTFVLLPRLFADTGILGVQVTDCRDTPLKDIRIGVVNGASLATRTIDGVIRLPLSPLVRPGTSVTLQLLSSPSTLVMLSPWDHHTIVPAFDTTDFVHVVIARRGDDEILHSASCLGGIARRLILDPGAAQAAGLPGAATKESRLKLVAKDYGLPPDTIDLAIRSLLDGVSSENRALAEMYAQQYDKANDDFKAAEDADEANIHALEQHVASVYFWHAYNLYLEGHPLESVALYKKAVDKEPENPIFLNNYAVSLRVIGNYSEAEVKFRRVLVLQQSIWGAEDVRLVPAMNNLAQTLLAENMIDEATTLFTNGLRIRRTKLKEHDIRIAHSEADLGALEAVLGRCETALPLLKHAQTFYHSSLTIWPEDDPTRNKKPEKPQRGQSQQAQGMSSVRLRLAPAPAPPPLPDVGIESKLSMMAGSIPNGTLGLNRIDSGQPSESRLLVSEASCTVDISQRESLLHAALTSAQARFGENNFEAAYAMIALGDFDRQHNKREDGERLLTDALAIYDRQLGPNNPEVISLQQEIARVF